MARGSRVALKFGLVVAAMIAAAVMTWAASPMGGDPIYQPHFSLCTEDRQNSAGGMERLEGEPHPPKSFCFQRAPLGRFAALSVWCCG
jgi:hypothetical protein